MIDQAVDILRSWRDGSNDDEVDRYCFFDSQKDMLESNFQLGMRFTDGEEFRTAVRNYSINEGKTCKFRPSEPKRVRAICSSKDYKWFIFISIEAATESKYLILKSLNLTHNNCNHVLKNKFITAKWVASRYIERIRVNPRIPTASIRQQVDEQF